MPAASRVFAGVSGSPGSVHALRHAADLARQNDAVLIPLHAWVPPCGDLDERKHPSLALRQLWQDDAWQLLWDTLNRAFGGLPAGIATQPVVRRGKPGKVLADLARQPGDLDRCRAPAAADAIHAPVVPGDRRGDVPFPQHHQVAGVLDLPQTGASSRNQAVTLSRELGLLEDDHRMYHPTGPGRWR